MGEFGKKLGNLSLAILENFVEKNLGKKFVDELKLPTDRALAIQTALENVEDRFQNVVFCFNLTYNLKLFTKGYC